MNINNTFSSYVNGIVRANERLHLIGLFLIELGSFTNLVICRLSIYLCVKHRLHAIKLAAFWYVTISFVFVFKES